MYSISETAAVVGVVFGAVQPKIAEASGLVDPLSNWAQVGVCGLFGVILIVLIYKNAESSKEVAASNERGMRSMGEANERGMQAVAGEVRGMRDDMQEMQTKQFDLLREVVNRQ